MTFIQTKPFQLGAALLAAALAPGAVEAQSQSIQSYNMGRPGTPPREDAATALARYLRGLSESPRSVGLLIGAGNAALEMGDPQAAMTFFARAEEEAPRDGRVKAGLGSALILTEQPQAALKFFADATLMGIPDHMIAKDRGLAYDMMGDQARAQADYALALSRGSDAETERRMALSKAISGDRTGALAVLEPQMSRRDYAGWRARAFVLALTGGTAEAVNAVEAVMSDAQANAMQPFLAQLPHLTPQQKAMAVHFGRFPGPAQLAANDAAPPLAAGRPDSSQASLGSGAAPSPSRQSAPPAATQARREQPQESASRPRPTVPIRAPIRVRMADSAARARQAAEAAEREPVVQSPPAQQPVAARIDPPVQSQPQPQPIERRALIQPIQTAELDPSAAAFDQPPPAQVESQPVAADTELDFADIAASIAALPEAASAPAKVEAPKPAPKKAKPAAPREPARIWVQVAAARNKAAFPAEFKRIKGKAPKLLSGTSAWTTPLGSTNRLLVGPFKTEKEARDLVNELAKVNVDSLSWTSAAGQEIEKLPAK